MRNLEAHGLDRASSKAGRIRSLAPRAPLSAPRAPRRPTPRHAPCPGLACGPDPAGDPLRSRLAPAPSGRVLIGDGHPAGTLSAGLKTTWRSDVYGDNYTTSWRARTRVQVHRRLLGSEEPAVAHNPGERAAISAPAAAGSSPAPAGDRYRSSLNIRKTIPPDTATRLTHSAPSVAASLLPGSARRVSLSVAVKGGGGAKLRKCERDGAVGLTIRTAWSGSSR